LRGLTLALHSYHEIHGSFPPAYTVDENGKPLHSWRVLILPYIEQRELYDKIRLDEPWDSEYNRQFHDVQVSIEWRRMFQCRTRREMPFSRIYNVFVKNRDLLRYANCDFSVVIGEGTPFPGSTTTTLDDIADTSNTILIVERMVPINWMDPNNEIRFEVAREGINRNLLGIGSVHQGGAFVAFTVGSTRFLNETIENIESLLMKSAEN
jgi:hypothetical protein